jgi:sigma-B regulation protein RsbU (phosphoserine phosphatase)
VVKNLVLPLGEGITGAAGATRQPVLVGDVRKDPRYLPALDAVQAELAVPMLARGKLVGVIDLQSTHLDAYREQDRALLQLIASRVAVSIDNARLYRRVDRQNRTLKTLANLSQEFSSILDLDELLGKIAVTIHALVAFDAFSILLLNPDRKVLTHRFSERYDQRVAIDNIPLGKGITGAAAVSREIVRAADTAADPRYIASHPDMRSEIAVPLIVQDRVVGVMDLEAERVGYFTEDHSRLLALLAPQIASSVENARLYQELAKREQSLDYDLKAARNLQSVLLLREAPKIKGLDIAIRLKPAREITGDVYDVFEHGGDYAVFTFGDVSGKGAAAALYGAMVSGLLRTLSYRLRSPAALLKLLNNVLREIIKPKVGGVPAGLMDNREYEEVTFDTEPGDVIVLYSDGITDQPNAKEEDFGRHNVAHSLLSRCGKDPEMVADGILDDLAKFTGDMPMHDDQTLIVLRVR